MGWLSGLGSSFSWIFGGAGLVMVGAAFFRLVKQQRFVARAARVEAKVVGYEASTDENDGSTVYFPILEFKDLQAVDRRLKSALGTTVKGYPLGAAVSLLYDPAKPEQGEIESFGRLWGFDIFLAAPGAFFAFIALGAHLK